MTRRKATPDPVFTPWDKQSMGIRHHSSREQVGQITESSGKWHLAWKHYLPPSEHSDGLHAVAAATGAYADYLAAEEEEFRDVLEEGARLDRFLQRQAGAVARAVRIPTGGQKRPTTNKK